MTHTLPVSILGCGYIGKRLGRQLLEKGVDAHGFVSSESSLNECRRSGIRCSIIDLDSVITDIDLGGRGVIYLAPPPRTGQSDPRMMHFLRSIDEHPPAKFVLVSTTGVYGDCQGEWIDESQPLKPTADRAIRRADAERQVQAFCHRHGIALVILRVAGIYGPGKIPVARIRSGQPIVSQQDSPYTNRIHADDLVNVCETALLSSDINGIYNVTDGHPGTMCEYFTAVAAALDLPAPPVISLQQAQQQLSEGMLSYMAESRRIGNSKLLKDFDLVLQYPTLKHGLKHIADTAAGA